MESFKTAPKCENVCSGEDCGKALSFLYKTASGRFVLRAAVKPVVSRMGGFFLKTRASKLKISGFVARAGIDLSEYEPKKYRSFNDFFTRRILPEKRPIDLLPEHLISPCDGKLSAYRIAGDSSFMIKGRRCTLPEMLQNAPLARSYEGGVCLVLRLCVDDYHRYCYIDSGFKSDNVHIAGRLHTVQSVALERRDVFLENEREYTVLHTENFGDVTQIEIGALMVGKITNHLGAGPIRRGEEKGLFQFGGSTIVLLLQKDAVSVSNELFAATAAGLEAIVKLGEAIALKVRKEFAV